MKVLIKWHYEMELGGGGDAWRLTGIRDGEKIYTSTPVLFDEENMVVTTVAGSRYKLENCDGNLKEQIQYIKEDIARCGTLII